MPHTEQFFKDLDGENRQAALLVAQVGAAPNELQLITQVAEYAFWAFWNIALSTLERRLMMSKF